MKGLIKYIASLALAAIAYGLARRVEERKGAEP